MCDLIRGSRKTPPSQRPPESGVMRVPLGKIHMSKGAVTEHNPIEPELQLCKKANGCLILICYRA